MSNEDREAMFLRLVDAMFLRLVDAMGMGAAPQIRPHLEFDGKGRVRGSVQLRVDDVVFDVLPAVALAIAADIEGLDPADAFVLSELSTELKRAANEALAMALAEAAPKGSA